MENEENIFDHVSIWLMIIAIGLVVFSFVTSISRNNGDLISPSIAFSSMIPIVLVFYRQLMANKSLKQQIKNQNNLFRKTQIENQFYEMLKLHKENLNDLFIVIEEVDNVLRITGRGTFQYFINELSILYQVKKQLYPNEIPDTWIKGAYNIFFYGISKFENEMSDSEKTILKEIQQKAFNEVECETYLKQKYIHGKGFHHEFFAGYADKLGHYYRHLYQTVKFIANQTELIYSEKRNLLNMLRAQLSNQEQIMLFYYWKSNLDTKWEDENNKFFTDYRMIHNVPNKHLDFEFIEIFKSQYYKKDKSQNEDVLFEFQHC